jgi:hypothetical protein
VARLNRHEILQGILQTLVDGWGQSAVSAALDAVVLSNDSRTRKRKKSDAEARAPNAMQLVVDMELPADRKAILIELAKRFDDGSAFPKLGDIRSFLLSHHRSGVDLKGRIPAFRRMIPILVEMSPKGLEKVLARSHHSGPADLGAISDAISGTGADLRGSTLTADSRIDSELPLVDESSGQIASTAATRKIGSTSSSMPRDLEKDDNGARFIGRAGKQVKHAPVEKPQ